MIKRAFILAIASILVLSNSFAQKKGKTITFTGHVEFRDPSGKYPIYLGQYVGDDFDRSFKVLDSTKVDANNNFSFKVPADKPDFYDVQVLYSDYMTIWADKDDIHVNLRGIDTAKMPIKNPPYIYLENGGPNNDLINDVNLVNYLNYQNSIAVGQEQYQAGLAKEPKWVAYMQDGFDRNDQDMIYRIKYLVNKHKDLPAVLYALDFLNPEKHQDFILTTLDYVTKKHPNLAQANKKKQDILAAQAQRVKIANGQKAPDFAYPDVNGKNWSPKDFKGKYLIIDFWASWCGPCRQEIPHLKQVYKKYKDKGLEILAVSVDAKEADWKRALGEENMAWPQINAKESKPVMASYLFNGIPYLVLVDQEGNIIEKNLRGDSLDAKLKEVFGM